jgi:hypothetical protein
MNRSQFYLGKIVSRGNLRKNRFRRCSGFLIQQRVFALVFTALRTVADARCFSHFVFAPRCADLRRFAAKISQTIEKAVKSLPIARGRVEMYQLG